MRIRLGHVVAARGRETHGKAAQAGWIAACVGIVLCVLAVFAVFAAPGHRVFASGGPVLSFFANASDPVLDGDFVQEPAGAITTSVSSVQELVQALEEAVPGEVIELADGEYDAAGMLLIEQKSGTAEAPIIIRAEHPGKAVIVGHTWFRIADSSYVVIQDLRFETDSTAGGVKRAIEVIDSDHCRVTRNAFALRQADSFSANGAVHWLYIKGAATAHNRIDHNHFANKRQSGNFIVIEGEAATGSPGTGAVPAYTRIDRNYFQDVTPSNQNGAEAIRIGGGSQTVLTNAYTTVERNVFDRCSGEAEIISVKSSGNVIRYNTFLESEGALVLRYGNGSEVYGNYFFGNGKAKTAGVRIHGTDHRVYNNYFAGLAADAVNIGWGDVDDDPTVATVYWQVKRTEVAFNTFAYNGGTVIASVYSGGSRVLGPLDTTVDNNIVIGDAGTFVRESSGGHPMSLSWAGNIMYPTGSATMGVVKTSGEIRQTDPLLEQGGDRLYRPGQSSPAIDAAVGAYAWIAEDIEGRARDAVPDAGAMEYAVIPPRTPPVLSGVSSPFVLIGETLQATSSQDGMIVLLPGAPYVTRTVYEAVYATGWTWGGGASKAAQAGVAAALDTDGLTEGTYSLYAIDAEGNVSAGIKLLLLAEADFAAVVDDTDPTVSESGTWTELVGDSYFLGTMRRANENGAYADIPFYGKQARLYATTASNYGKAELYVDGVLRSTIDLYSPTTQTQQLVFDTGLLPEGNHTVRVKVIRQRNELSQGFYVTYDVLKIVREDQLSPGLSDVTAGPLTVGDPVAARSTKDGTLFLVPSATPANRSAVESAAATANGSSVTVAAGVYGTLDTAGFASGIYVVYATDAAGNLSASSAGIRIVSPNDIDDTDGAVHYSGTWTELASDSYFLGTVRRANANGAYADIPFYGTRAKLYAALGSNYGKADIYVDGVYRSTVDTYSPTAASQQELFDTGVLTEGNHVVRIVVIRQRNAASQGFYVTFDVLRSISE